MLAGDHRRVGLKIAACCWRTLPLRAYWSEVLESIRPTRDCCSGTQGALTVPTGRAPAQRGDAVPIERRHPRRSRRGRGHRQRALPLLGDEHLVSADERSPWRGQQGWVSATARHYWSAREERP